MHKTQGRRPPWGHRDQGQRRIGDKVQWPVAPAHHRGRCKEKAQHRPAALPLGRRWVPGQAVPQGGEPEERASAAWEGGEPRVPNCLSSPGHNSHASPPLCSSWRRGGLPKARMRLSGQRSGESEPGLAPGLSKNNPRPTFRLRLLSHAGGSRGASQWALLTPVRAWPCRECSLPRWGLSAGLQRSLRTPGNGTVPPIS